MAYGRPLTELAVQAKPNLEVFLRLLIIMDFKRLTLRVHRNFESAYSLFSFTTHSNVFPIISRKYFTAASQIFSNENCMHVFIENNTYKINSMKRRRCALSLAAEAPSTWSISLSLVPINAHVPKFSCFPSRTFNMPLGGLRLRLIKLGWNFNIYPVIIYRCLVFLQYQNFLKKVFW